MRYEEVCVSSGLFIYFFLFFCMYIFFFSVGRMEIDIVQRRGGFDWRTRAGLLTSRFECRESTMSWDTPTADDLKETPCQRVLCAISERRSRGRERNYLRRPRV